MKHTITADFHTLFDQSKDTACDYFLAAKRILDNAEIGYKASDVIALARTEVDKKKVTLILNCIYPNSNMSVPDPYFGGEQGFEKVFILLDNACEAIAEALKRTS